MLHLQERLISLYDEISSNSLKSFIQNNDFVACSRMINREKEGNWEKGILVWLRVTILNMGLHNEVSALLI